MIRQLAFDLPYREARGREDFFVSPANALALAAVEGWRGWPGGRLVLCGPPGSGKTHLVQVWQATLPAPAAVVAGAALRAADLPALAAAGAVAVEDAAAVAGDPAAETALFHLHNLLAQGGGHLLVTAATPPRDWGLTLPDLASRMQGAALARLEAPDDALLSAVLAKQFADRQIAISPALIPYLVARMDRSMAAARDLVARLDAAALARGQAVTRALAATVLDSA
ncbi:MAG TPA: DnaA/Hda family protein [Paracoccaceae bacterium]|nr:DnaA/Hda family protein [Paracoccaceae bacterium]